ncbi:MAG TPA: hypothetical protein PLR02_11850, partial [Rhodocyclaceae bacterium]|nr:hypothetical protein [Rhodocyclaceae bacterium]
ANVQKYYPAYTPGTRFDAALDRFGGKYEEKMVGRFGLGCLLARRLIERGMIGSDAGTIDKASQLLPVDAHLVLYPGPPQDPSQDLDET